MFNFSNQVTTASGVNAKKSSESPSYAFPAITGFNDWKLEIEKETHSRYVRSSGHRKVSNGNKIRKEFFCHRSFMPIVKTEERKRSVKSLGTNKRSVAYPSRMCVEIEKTEVNVDFIWLHLGHQYENGTVE